MLQAIDMKMVKMNKQSLHVYCIASLLQLATACVSGFMHCEDAIRGSLHLEASWLQSCRRQPSSIRQLQKQQLGIQMRWDGLRCQLGKRRDLMRRWA